MPALEHVCMWSDEEKRWKRVTVEKAASIFPNNTVSAHSGLFMCELCGQYVLLTNSVMQTRHFRHSSEEKSKNCPDRVSTNNKIGYGSKEHELPIRICDISEHYFDFEIGLIRVPEVLLNQIIQIEIESESGKRIYSKERLNIEGITYLPLGEIPCSEYKIKVTGAYRIIYEYWPKSTPGIDPAGTLFDASTGKKLVNDSDVVINKKYYLLTRGFTPHNNSVKIKEVSHKTAQHRTWHLCEVTASEYNEGTAKFFMDYHCRLTSEPVKLQIVWPVYVETPYVIKHNRDSVIIHQNGDIYATKVYPYAETSLMQKEKALKIPSSNSQQMISAGRTNALQYLYLWRMPLDRVIETPTATVKDIHDKLYESGTYNVFPDKKILRITIPFDGMLCVKLKGEIIEKRSIAANSTIEVSDIGWNREYNVYVGLDPVWSASFVRDEKHSTKDEEMLLERLQSYAGEEIPVPHTLGSIASKMSEYPRIKNWLYKCIREGHMSRHAYQELVNCIISDEKK